MSTHRVDVIRVQGLTKHPNADSLSILKVHGGFTVVVRTADWNDGDLAAYIEPDYVIDPSRPEFSFLAGHPRIKVKRLRGIYSQGLLIKAPEGTNVGDNVMELLGVTRYEPHVPMSTGGETEKPPSGIFAPVYDVENWRRYRNVFLPDEEVIAREKVHGCCASYVWAHERMWARSRTEWKKEDAGNLWWRCLAQNQWISEWCREHRGDVLYGECFGQVQDLKYGAKPGELFFRAFDALYGSDWLDNDSLQNSVGEEHLMPVLYRGPHGDGSALEACCDGPTLLNGAEHVREGIVVRPVVNRTCPEIGRVQGKLVSNMYLERA